MRVQPRYAADHAVDLCQNPLTVSKKSRAWCTLKWQKEPKLVRARQIPEWDLYDQEIAAFATRVSAESGALAASVDDLAAEKGGAAMPSLKTVVEPEEPRQDDESRHIIDEL